jgi:hypothetical protein
MLSSKSNSKVKPYVKEQDSLYCGLLKLACVSDQTDYTPDVLKQAVITLNSLPDYVSVHQRIIPLLNAKARTLGIFEKLSERTRQLLILFTQQGIISELAKSKQLKQILDVLMAQDIPVILLKGVAFNNLLYTSDAPRTSNDIDLLVKKEHWQQAQTAISSIMVYAQKTRPDVFGDAYEVSFKPLSKVGSSLDLHMSLINPGLFDVNQQALWQSSVVHPHFEQDKVRMLSPEYALVHQAIHAYQDMNFCKYNLVDSHELISNSKPDLALTIAIAKEWGTSLAGYYLLKNCMQIMGSQVDEQLLTKIAPSPYTQYVADSLLASKFAQPTATSKPMRYRINQVLSQFVFTGSITRPIHFQWLFISTFFKQKFKLTAVKNACTASE